MHMSDRLGEPQVLLVEDEVNVGSTLFERMISEGFAVIWAKTAAEALSYGQRQKFDAVLMDVGLPDGSGFDVAKNLRTVAPGTAIVFLTAYSGAEDRIKGLELGAEDYVIKPFHLKELILRLRNAIRRARFVQETAPGNSEGGSVMMGNAKIDFGRFQATVKNQVYFLTHKEWAVLKLLYERLGEVVSRDQILESVWGDEEFPTTRTIDNFILKLRKIIEPTPESPRFLRSVRGVGYQLVLNEVSK